MGEKEYDNPDPCVSILIINDDGDVLLGLRGESQISPGKWCLPCGYMEGTGIDIKPEGIVNVVSNHFGDDYTSLVVVILARPAAGEKDKIRPGDDIVDVGWFGIDDLPDMAFKADLHIIGQFVRFGWSLGIRFEDTTIEFFEGPRLRTV